VDEHGRAQGLGRLEDREERGVVEVPGVHVAADLDAGQPKLPHAALELGDRRLRRLHGQRAEAGEAAGMGAHDRGDVVVQEPREVERVLGLRPVAEHDGHRRERLHADAGLVALLEPAPRVPAGVADLAEERVVDHHPRPAGRVVLEADEAAVAVPGPELGPPLGEDVRVDVDLQHRPPPRGCPAYLAGAGGCMTAPHFLQVRSDSLP
jgi:hypothetical protein